jgi:hypothetical protein
MALVLQSLGIDGAAIAQVGQHVGELLGDTAEVAGLPPIGGLLGLVLAVLPEAGADTLQQVLGFGVPLRVTACGGLFGFGVLHRESIHHFGGD